MSTGILYCFIKKKKKAPFRQLLLLENSFTFLRVTTGTRLGLNVPGLVRHCNQGTFPGVVAVGFVR